MQKELACMHNSFFFFFSLFAVGIAFCRIIFMLFQFEDAIMHTCTFSWYDTYVPILCRSFKSMVTRLPMGKSGRDKATGVDTWSQGLQCRMLTAINLRSVYLMSSVTMRYRFLELANVALGYYKSVPSSHWFANPFLKCCLPHR